MDFMNTIFYNNKFVEIYPWDGQSDESLEIRDYLNGNIIACFPDINSISKVAGGARNLQRKWNILSRKDKIEMLEQTGERLVDRSEYDKFIASGGGFPIKYVEEARKEIGNYLKNSEIFLQKNPGRGPVVAATSVTAPIIQPFIMTETLYGNCSFTIKGDSREPFSAYMLADISFEIGLPIQFITYRTSGKKAFAGDLYNMCRMDGGHFILMGDPSTPKNIAYGKILNQIDLNALPLPQNMIAFTAHGGSMIVDESSDILKAVGGAIDSFKYPRACKVPTGIFVFESILDEFIDELCKIVRNQTVGDVLNRNADIAKLSETHWNIVDDFIRIAKTNGEIVHGGKINQPTIIKGHFYSSLSMEPQFPVYCIEAVDDETQAIGKINDVASNTPQRKILDLSVYSENESLLQKIHNLRKEGLLKVHSLHFNRPTLSYNPYTAHEGIILREFLSEPHFLDSEGIVSYDFIFK